MEPTVQQSETSILPARAIPTAEPQVEAARSGAAPSAAAVPAVLQRSAFERHFAEYVRELKPVGHVELMLVREMARHTAAVDAWNEGLGALEREQARRLPLLLPFRGGDEEEREDIALAVAVGAPGVHLVERHGQGRSRAFCRALRTLLELQSRRKQRQARDEKILVTEHCATESDCEDYLVHRFERGHYQCPRCGCRRGHYLAARSCWQCSGCKRQAGLRAGTVMAGSPVPLLVWFRAVYIVLLHPSISAAQLADNLGIRRVATARKMAGKIRAALGADDSSALLAGLDQHSVRGGPSGLSQAPASERNGRRGGVAAPASAGAMQTLAAAMLMTNPAALLGPDTPAEPSGA